MPREKHEGLRMERLFEILLFNEIIIWEGWSTNKVRWATDFPLDNRELDTRERDDDELYAMMPTFGLVIVAHRIMQCSIRPNRPKTEDEQLREQLVAAYIEAGFDIDLVKSSVNGVEIESVL